MTASGRPSAGLRVHAFCLDTALVVAVVVFVVLAAIGPNEKRGAYIGIAIVSGAMAVGAVALTVAMERRLRRPPKKLSLEERRVVRRRP